jgi:hypothetical protein
MRDKETALCLAGGLLAVALVAGSTGSKAADFGASCCSDLDERIAELEATTARKGNRKVSLAVSGHVNKTLLGWNDGFEDGVYVVGNKNDQTAISFTGDAEIAPHWKAGYDLTLRFRDSLSDAVDQTTPNGDDGYFLWQSHWWVESEAFGKASVGLAPRATDTVPETDLSGAGVAAYAGVQDIAGGFSLRLANGVLAPITWGDLYNHFNGDTANVVRYDTPILHGFSGAATWGEDDGRDIAVRYSGEVAGFQLEGAIGYADVTDGDNPVIGNSLGLDQHTAIASISILHQATGLNGTFAAGNRMWDEAIVDLDNEIRTPEDTRFIYTKLGWLTKLSPLGPTAFYAEYGVFTDFICAGQDIALLAALDSTGTATRFTGSEANVWGLGVVQAIDAAEMQIYVGFRRHSASFDLVDGAGNGVAANSVEDLDTVIAGSKVAF